MQKVLHIATDFQTPSYSTVSNNIALALAEKCGIQCVVQHWMNTPDNVRNVLVMGSFIHQTANYLWRFDDTFTNVIFYCTTEGYPIVTHADKIAANRKNVTVIAVSEFVKHCLEDIGIKVRGVVPHGIPMDAAPSFSRPFYSNLKKEYGKSKVILNISHNNVRKGLSKLLMAYKLVEYIVPKSFLFLHSGLGPEGYEGIDIQKASLQLELKRFWCTGQYQGFSDAKIGSLYKMASVYACTSLAEGFGLPLIESLHRNIPIVAVDAPPFNEIVTDGVTGLLVPCKKTYILNLKDMMNCIMHDYSVEDFANALVILLNNHDVRRKMVNAIKRRKWQWDSMKVYPQFEKYMKL